MPQKPTNVSIRLNGIQDFQSPCSEHPPKGEVLQYSVSNLTAFYSTNKRKCHNLINDNLVSGKKKTYYQFSSFCQ